MGIMETLGYVKHSEYEEVVRERDSLRMSVAELEGNIDVLEADKKRLKEKIEFLKMAVPTITKIKNIGRRTAEKLEESGIKDIIDLIESSPEKVVAATGLSKERAIRLIEKATNLIKKQA